MHLLQQLLVHAALSLLRRAVSVIMVGRFRGTKHNSIHSTKSQKMSEVREISHFSLKQNSVDKNTKQPSAQNKKPRPHDHITNDNQQ
jgi:hypothetical protein